MANQEDSMATQLSQLLAAAKEKLPDNASFGEFRAVLIGFLIELSPHLEMQPMETAPKDRMFLAVDEVGSIPYVCKWETYDESNAEEMGTDGYWLYAEDLIADVAGSCDPVGWWELPELQSIAQKGE